MAGDRGIDRAGETVGLTLGKYAPLHKGHQFVIETARRETDHVIVIVYDAPRTTRVPLNVRAGWIRALYPDVQVIEAWDGPEAVGDTPQIRALHESYVTNRLNIAGVTHFYSSEFYGDHMSRALGAVNRIVDNARNVVPVSGTAIRADPHAHRDFLDPLVYRDLVANIVFLGAPSTGKTTLAQALAERFGTVWMPEYGREYWEAHHVERRLTPAQLVEIADGHIEREERLLWEANRYLFTDTNALTTRIFAQSYHGGVLPRLSELADACAARYDLTFVCDTDIPYADTWDRSGADDRGVFQKRILGDLAARHIPYFLVRGDLDARLRCVTGILSRFVQYENIMSIYADERSSP